MDETPHLVTHFMAVGAEKRLEDYHFLRNTYETITGQEIQLNRILRMLGEDEFSLNWRTDLLPIGRSRSRSLYEFDRWNNPVVLKGSIAYERLRDLEHETFRPTREPSVPTSSRRVQEIRERRQRLSEQRECPPSSTTSSGSGAFSSSSRLRALAEYDTAVAESEKKRQRQAEENRLNTSKDEGKEVTERRREKYKSMLEDENPKYGKSKQQEDEPSNRSAKTSRLDEEKAKKATEDPEKDSDRIRKSSTKSDHKKTTDMELASFTVRCEPLSSSKNKQGKEEASVRLLCKWAAPSSSSTIDYYTIERQCGDEEWLVIGEKIEKYDNQTQLDISLSKEADKPTKATAPSYFRLKAHLRNGQTFMSKPTDGISLNLAREKNIIIPDVEILSANSVRVTWEDEKKTTNDNENLEHQGKGNLYDIEKKEEQQTEWEKVIEVPLSQRSARIDSLTDAKQCQFRLIPASSEPEETKQPAENQVESGQLTVHNVNEWLSSLHIVPASPTTVDVDISEEGFKEYDCYKIEYTTVNRLDQWKQMSDITRDDPHLTIDNLKQGTEYKFRFTPILSETTTSETNSSQLSLILDVKMPSARRGRFTQNESETPVATSPQLSAKEVFTDNEADSVSAKSSEFSNKEVFADNEFESSVATPSQFSKKNVFIDNEPESATVTSSQFSNKNVFVDNEAEGSIATPSQFSKKNVLVDNETESSIATPSQFSKKNVFVDNEAESPTATSSQFSLQKDVDENENETSVASSRRDSSEKDVDENDNEASTAVAAPPQFKIQKLDSTSVLIEAIVPEEEPVTFEDAFDVYSKNETLDEDWTKVGTIDKEHLSTTMENLEENTAYAFKIDNTTSPSADDESNTVQEFKFNTTPVKRYDPSSFLEKIEESLENVVNGVMQAAAGHQMVDEPINKSLNDVIKEVFRDETLLPSEAYGFDTLALNSDIQLYRGPKQMMLKDLEVDETVDLSKHYGEIIIHNYRTSQQSVIVREENGNTRVANIDGDIIIRNVVSDVLLKNEQTHHQLSMNIVGQAFLKGVQGTLIASKFRGIIIVKTVHKP